MSTAVGSKTVGGRACAGFWAVMAAVFLATSSCVSTSPAHRVTTSEMNEKNIVKLGEVEMKFESFQIFHVYTARSMENRARKKLMVKARNEFPNYKIDVVNVSTFGLLGMGGGFLVVLLPPSLLLGNLQEIRASGDVITSDPEAVANARKESQREKPREEPKPRQEAIPPTTSYDGGGGQYAVQQITCPTCGGVGIAPCQMCGGSGYLWGRKCGMCNGIMSMARPCQTCNASGTIPSNQYVSPPPPPPVNYGIGGVGGGAQPQQAPPSSSRRWHQCVSCGGHGRCTWCKGTGYNEYTKNNKCGRCRGKGTCPSCNGKGGKYLD